jgi:RNA polymerase sigma-70 factor (ECF subfamily)
MALAPSNKRAERGAAGVRREDWDDLMRAALRGDEAAYRRLLDDLARAFRAATRAIFARAGRGDLDAEDTVQEILLAVHLKRHTWDAAAPLAPWAMTIARYKTIDALRRRGRAVHVDIDDFAGRLPAPPPRVEEGRASALVERLDPRQRALVRGMSIEGLSAREMGARLEMSEGAARVALHRALKRLAALYRREEANEDK